MSYVSFINDEEYIGVASFESKREGEKRVDGKRIVYYYKTAPCPYIEMVNAENK